MAKSRRALTRQNAFLADRMISWFPGRTIEELTLCLESLSDEEYWKTFKAVFEANTTLNLGSASILCAQNGWFIDLEFPGSGAGTLVALITEGKEVEAWELLEQYFEQRRPAIESELVERFPRRQKLLRSFFRSHDAGDFDLAIPLGLIQADGICQDVYGTELYRVKKKASPLSRVIKQKKVDWLWAAAVTPLRDALPLALHQPRSSKKFNRHLILHGMNLDYGTRENSFRVISLLSYLQGMAAYEYEVVSRNLEAMPRPSPS